MRIYSRYGTAVVIFLVALSLGLTGCTQLRDKFVRKKKEAPVKRYYAVKQYDIHPSIELYTKRYVYWKNWHRELLNVLKDPNMKKVTTAIEQDISNLADMRAMLVDAKAEELQKSIDDMVVLAEMVRKEKITMGNETRIRRRIELVGSTVKSKFSYNKMRSFIRPDFNSNADTGTSADPDTKTDVDANTDTNADNEQ